MQTTPVTQYKLIRRASYVQIRGLRVYPYPRVSPYPTRTRGSGTGRVRISRVGSGTGRIVTGTGIPGFTRADLKFWGYNVAVTYNSESCTVKDLLTITG